MFTVLPEKKLNENITKSKSSLSIIRGYIEHYIFNIFEREDLKKEVDERINTSIQIFCDNLFWLKVDESYILKKKKNIYRRYCIWIILHNILLLSRILSCAFSLFVCDTRLRLAYENHWSCTSEAKAELIQEDKQ